MFTYVCMVMFGNTPPPPHLSSLHFTSRPHLSNSRRHLSTSPHLYNSTLQLPTSPLLLTSPLQLHSRSHLSNSTPDLTSPHHLNTTPMARFSGGAGGAHPPKRNLHTPEKVAPPCNYLHPLEKCKKSQCKSKINN